MKISSSKKRQASFLKRIFLGACIAALLALMIPTVFASFSLSSGSESDLCTAPKYDGEADLIGRFFHHKFLFQNHQEYEFKPIIGEDSKLPLNQAYPQFNKILKLNLDADQATNLPADRVVKIKINNYQAYCEGLPSADFVSADMNFKNAEGHWILIQGSSEAGFLGDIIYDGEETIHGFLKSVIDLQNKTGPIYFLEVDAKDQPLLPLQDWVKIIPKFNTIIKIENQKEKKAWLEQNLNKQIFVTIDRYSITPDGSPQARIKTNFYDVGSKNSFAQAIQFLKSHDIVGGYSDGTFRSERTLNRAEFAKIALLSKFSDTDIGRTENCFTDVKADWFAPYVCALKSGGAIQGYASPLISTKTAPLIFFYPQKTITVAEALKIIMKISGIQYDETPVWTDGIMAKAEELGLPGFLVEDPNTALTRGEMAAMIAKLIELKL